MTILDKKISENNYGPTTKPRGPCQGPFGKKKVEKINYVYYVRYLNGTNIPSLVKFKTLIVKVIGVIFSISGGLTCGKEGPLVHVGAVCGAIYSHAPTLATRCGNDRYRRYRNDHDKRDFVSGGNFIIFFIRPN